jgi:sensor histidine kinase regulating citrate/malate metabolism
MKVKTMKGSSIGVKVSVVLIISILISTFAVGVFCYSSYRSNSMSLAGEKAEAIAYSIASEIDGDKFTVYSQTGKKDEYFKQMQDTMSEIKKKCGADYVYSMEDAGDEYRYVISGFTEGQMEEEGDDFLTTDKKSIYVGASTVLKKGISIYNKPEKSNYGLLISGYAPIFNSRNHVVGFVGIDMNVDREVADVNRIIPVMIIMIAITSFILFLASYRFINKTVSRPLRGIAEKSRLISIGDTEIQIEESYLKRSDEIGLISRGFVEIAKNTKEQACRLSSRGLSEICSIFLNPIHGVVSLELLSNRGEHSSAIKRPTVLKKTPPQPAS